MGVSSSGSLDPIVRLLLRATVVRSLTEKVVASGVWSSMELLLSNPETLSPNGVLNVVDFIRTSLERDLNQVGVQEISVNKLPGRIILSLAIVSDGNRLWPSCYQRPHSGRRGAILSSPELYSCSDLLTFNDWSR